MIFRRALIAILGAIAFAACAPAPSSDAQEGDAMITLTRTVCFGFCPAYTVTVSESGEVVYTGEQFVNVRGEQRAQVSREAVRALIARFDEIGFDDLRDEYRAGVSDHPTFTVTLERNGRSKTVIDYAGVNVGMPRAVRELQDEIDRVAGTAQWILRDGQPVRDRPEH